MRFLSARSLVLWVVPALLMYLLISTVAAQAIPSFTGQGPSPLPSQILSPSNPLGAPGSAYGPSGSDCIPLSSGMLGSLLPRIPNFELGFLYNIGNNLSSGRLYADYLAPFGLGGDSVLFGEAHGEFQDFWKSPQVSTVTAPGFTVTNSTANNRTDLSFGGGYRRLMGKSGFLGINAFYDSTKLYGKWYSSGGVGLEMVALTPGDGAIDLNFNWYGNLLNRSELINTFRNQAGSWDIEAGVSQPLLLSDQALDLRLNATAYDFNIGSAVYGWRAGAELTTRNGFFTFKYEHGHDRVNGSYDTVGGFVNVGFQMENLVRGESPFMSPEPVFGSPRNLRRLLGLKVRRNWHQPAAVVLTRQGQAGGQPYFLVSFGSPSQGTFVSYVQDLDNSHGTLTITYVAEFYEASSYTIVLVGDTVSLSFPLIVTVTPTAIASLQSFSVRQDNNIGAEFTIMSNSSDLTKIIPPDGSGSVIEGVPSLEKISGGPLQATITISAPGVKTLTIDVVSTN